MSEERIPSEVYEELVVDRKPYEDRAEVLSNLTLPYLMNPDSFNGNTETRTELAQSFNGMLVNNLKAKIGMSLLPPSTSSFRFKPDAIALAQILGNDTQRMEELNKQLSIQTDAVNSEIEKQQIRSDLFTMIAYLIVVGSVVVEKIEKGGIQVIPLRNFVVELDNKGNPYTIVIKETLKFLPENITPREEKEEYELYTMAEYDKESDKWIVKQDIDGEAVGDEKTYSYEDLPYRYLGWTWNVGDNYHRPFAEDYREDMSQINSLSKLNTEGAVIAAKSIIFVDQRGNRTRKKAVAESINGGVVDGRADDVTAFQLNKNYDFEVSNQRQAEIMRTLKECFLDNGSVTRDAERVTAQEIRIMAQQLESSTLSGIYSKMSLQFSKWIVKMIMNELKIKFDSIEVSVLTGLDALGRSQESQKLDGFMQRIAQLQLMEYINTPELIDRYASFEGINTQGLIKSDKDVQQARQQQQEAMAQQQAIESVTSEAGKAVVNSK